MRVSDRTIGILPFLFFALCVALSALIAFQKLHALDERGPVHPVEWSRV